MRWDRRHDEPSAPRDGVCRECGQPVTEFDYLGLTWQLEPAPLPITADLRAVRKNGLVWVFNPDSGKWTSKFGLTRDWRDTRAGHNHPATTRRERRTA